MQRSSTCCTNKAQGCLSVKIGASSYLLAEASEQAVSIQQSKICQAGRCLRGVPGVKGESRTSATLLMILGSNPKVPGSFAARREGTPHIFPGLHARSHRYTP